METVVMGKLDGIVGGDVDAGGEGVGDEESENERAHFGGETIKGVLEWGG
jgi:hypothetical protein